MGAPPGLLDFNMSQDSERPGFSLGDARRLLRKHALLIALAFLGVTAAVCAGVMLVPLSYSSSALVLIKLDDVGAPSFFSGIAATREAASQDSANRRVETEMEIAESWPIAAETVKQLGLTYDQVYQPPLTHLLRPISDIYDRYVVPLLGLKPDLEKHGFTDTVTAFMSGLEVRPVASKSSDTNSNIVSFTLRGIDPKRTREALNTLVGLYLVHDVNENRAAAERAADVVKKRIDVTQGEVAKAQADLEAWLAGPHADQAASESSSTQPASADGVTVASLKARILELETALTEQKSQLKEPTAQSRALQDAIAALRTQLAGERQKAARSEVEHMVLERTLRLKESDLNDLEKRLSQIVVYEQIGDGGLTNRVLVETPLADRSSDFKKHVVIVIAGSIAGLFLGLLLAGLRELLDPRIGSTADAQAALDVPVLVAFPTFKTARVRQSLETLRPSSLFRSEDA